MAPSTLLVNRSLVELTVERAITQKLHCGIRLERQAKLHELGVSLTDIISAIQLKLRRQVDFSDCDDHDTTVQGLIDNICQQLGLD